MAGKVKGEGVRASKVSASDGYRTAKEHCRLGIQLLLDEWRSEKEDEVVFAVNDGLTMRVLAATT